MKALPDSGFALIEVLVAMTIMALVGLMAWRGMDAMILGRGVIDRRANHDAVYTQLVNQFERDCQFILHAEVLGSNSLAVGAKNIWWVRQWNLDNRDAWMIVGYGITPAGLQRWTSTPLLQRSEAVNVWANVSRDPDLLSSNFRVSVTLPDIVRQTAVARTPLSSATATPDQRGVVMQWWLRNADLPITRSCLMGGAL